jgi:hypothetical protein
MPKAQCRNSVRATRAPAITKPKACVMKRIPVVMAPAGLHVQTLEVRGADHMGV